MRLKDTWINPGTHYPAEMVAHYQRLADELGISRNASFNLALKTALPILKATVRGLKGQIRAGCESQLTDSPQKFAPPVIPKPRGKRKG